MDRLSAKHIVSRQHLYMNKVKWSRLKRLSRKMALPAVQKRWQKRSSNTVSRQSRQWIRQNWIKHSAIWPNKKWRPLLKNRRSRLCSISDQNRCHLNSCTSWPRHGIFQKTEWNRCVYNNNETNLQNQHYAAIYRVTNCKWSHCFCEKPIWLDRHSHKN